MQDRPASSSPHTALDTAAPAANAAQALADAAKTPPDRPD